MPWSQKLSEAIEQKSPSQIAEVFQNLLTCEQFLCGPDGDDRELDVDHIFSKRFSKVIREALAYDPNSLDPQEGSIPTPSDIAEGYTFEEVKIGLVLRSPSGDIVGGYLSCDLSLDEEHQGQGLGAEIIIEYFLRNDGIPTWDLDTPAYSPAGQGAHISAWNHMTNNPEMVLQKAQRIMGTENSTKPSPSPF
jgi:GNAT superfamily N-acetyltransferase